MFSFNDFINVFHSCVACSKYVLDEYTKNRNEFLLKVINDPQYLQVK